MRSRASPKKLCSIENELLFADAVVVEHRFEDDCFESVTRAVFRNYAVAFYDFRLFHGERDGLGKLVLPCDLFPAALFEQQPAVPGEYQSVDAYLVAEL